MSKPHFAICCVPECKRVICDAFIMCGPHWRRLSYPERRAVALAIQKRTEGRLADTEFDRVKENAVDAVLAAKAKGGAA